MFITSLLSFGAKCRPNVCCHQRLINTCVVQICRHMSDQRVMSSQPSRGVLIVFEGVDRVGKSTQALRLLEALRTRSVSAQLITFPNRSTTIGQMISQYLKGDQHLDDRVIHLLFSANRWEMCKQLQDLLNCGTSVIVDRYAYSGAAYSAAKPNLDLEWCRQADKGLPKPDSVLYLTASEDLIYKRSGFGDEKYETKTFQEKVRHNYEMLKEKDWTVFNANKSEEELHKEIVEKVLKVIEELKTSKQTIKRLWID